MFSINIIGAGNLGKTIGRLLVSKKLAAVKGVWSRTPANTLTALEFIGEGATISHFSELPYADITFITTPDDFIDSTCAALAQQNHLNPGQAVVHCSGSLSSDILLPAAEAGCFTASLHPMRSFANPALSVQQFAGTYCALEGHPEAVDRLQSLFNQAQAITFFLDKDKKSLYHAAGVIASNYVVTLAKQAANCLHEAQVPEEVAMRLIVNLMRGTVTNLENTLSAEKSLTGPIQRGDIATIEKHLNAFTDLSLKKLYAMLAQATLPLSSAPQERKEQITEVLEHSKLSTTT
ncbi:Rossmann-like and DUF2520 domain-containing protein [Legionella dresdenensis]|uniref:Rossmann-like and DUF2520 domain-containing protein n=1 Tax=Legionella dresdenensis TaxID=450200 RepID=A0ABV8CGY4_9GAMM